MNTSIARNYPSLTQILEDAHKDFELKLKTLTEGAEIHNKITDFLNTNPLNNEMKYIYNGSSASIHIIGTPNDLSSDYTDFMKKLGRVFDRPAEDLPKLSKGDGELVCWFYTSDFCIHITINLPKPEGIRDLLVMPETRTSSWTHYAIHERLPIRSSMKNDRVDFDPDSSEKAPF